MKNNPLVSIITVNYNQAAVTAYFLESLSVLVYTNFEVIVVDNASAEPSAFLKEKFPFITHITSPQNIGFAGGNNIGLFFAKGEYVLFINNDTIVSPNLLDVLVGHLQSNEQCAIACPKIKYHWQPDTIQYAGAVGLYPITCRSYDIGYMQKDDGRFDDIRKTDLPNGAAMMVPMKLIKKIGPMSEKFFLYYEELDWAARFKSAGYEIHYVGTTGILHKESVSTGKNSPFKTFYLYRNRLLYIRRNYKGWKGFASSAFFCFVSVPCHSLKHVLKGEWGHVSSIAKGLFWHFANNPFSEPKINSVSLRNLLTVQS